MKREIYASLILLMVFIGCAALYRELPRSSDRAPEKDQRVSTSPDFSLSALGR